MFLKTLQWKLVIIFLLMAVFLVLIISLFLNQSIDRFYYINFTKSIEKGFDNWEVTDEMTGIEVKEYLKDKKKNALFFFSIDEYKSFTILSSINEILYSSDMVYKNSENDFINEIILSDNLMKGNSVARGCSNTDVFSMLIN